MHRASVIAPSPLRGEGRGEGPVLARCSIETDFKNMATSQRDELARRRASTGFIASPDRTPQFFPRR